MTEADPLYNDWIHQQLRVQPDGLALYDLTADRPFSWQQFDDRVDAVAHRLIVENVGPGDRVAYLGLNSSGTQIETASADNPNADNPVLKKLLQCFQT